MLNTLLRPASLLYGAVVARRNTRFDTGLGVVKTGLPVVSIGNLTVGGTGKTPCVQWAARSLIAAGHRPAIALRGYGSRPGQPSDEALEHRGALKGVPVLASPDRVASIETIRSEHPTCDVVILDDGFQHRRVAREVDVLLVDGRRVLDSERLLPSGRLREPLVSMARATDVVVTHSEHVADRDAMNAAITSLHGRPPVAWCTHKWEALHVHSAQGVTRVPLEHLRGLKLVTRFGIAHPKGPRDQAMAAGAVVVADIPAADHAPFGQAEVQAIESAARDADAVLVTGKDWVKLARVVDLNKFGVDIIVPDLSLVFTEGEDRLLERMLHAVSLEQT